MAVLCWEVLLYCYTIHYPLLFCPECSVYPVSDITIHSSPAITNWAKYSGDSLLFSAPQSVCSLQSAVCRVSIRQVLQDIPGLLCVCSDVLMSGICSIPPYTVYILTSCLIYRVHLYTSWYVHLLVCQYVGLPIYPYINTSICQYINILLHYSIV